MKFEIYRDYAREWRWRLKAQNGRTIADSGEGYKYRADCEHGVNLVKGAPVETVDVCDLVAALESLLPAFRAAQPLAGAGWRFLNYGEMVDLGDQIKTPWGWVDALWPYGESGLWTHRRRV